MYELVVDLTADGLLSCCSQEIVFIGVNLDEAKIRETLNHCLYTDEEMEVYRRELRSFQSVKSANKVSLFGPGVEFIENY